MTAGMTVGIGTYAMTTKTDFTIRGSLFLTLAIGLIMLVLCSACLSFLEWWHPLVSALLIVMYGLYLIYDV